MEQPPNMLYLFTDQQLHSALSCAGNADLHTPNLAVEKRYEEILNEHRRHLADWCGKTGHRFAEDDGKPGRANIPGLRYVDV